MKGSQAVKQKDIDMDALYNNGQCLTLALFLQACMGIPSIDRACLLKIGEAKRERKGKVFMTTVAKTRQLEVQFRFVIMVRIVVRYLTRSIEATGPFNAKIPKVKEQK